MTANPSTGFPSTIPDFMLVFSFCVTLLWTILRVVGLLRGGKLDLRLTRELFVRLIDPGECFFAHAVLVSHYGGVLIENARASIRKENGSIKEFPLEIIQYGEKYRSEIGIPQYYFYTTSPLAFIPQNNTYRYIYLCAHEKYSVLFRKFSSQFQLEINNFKQTYQDI